MSQYNDNMDNQTFLWVALLLIVLLGIPAVYAAKAGYINDMLISLALLQLDLFLAYSDEVEKAWAHIDRLDPAALSWEQMEGILRYSGKWIRWPMSGILLLCGVVAIFLGRTGGLVRRFNMDTLLKNNAESFACLKPVVGRGKYLLSPESYDSGLWRVARTPLQFALEHELLLAPSGKPFLPEQALVNGIASEDQEAWGSGQLDEGKALAVLQKQLGPVFSGFVNLSVCRQAAASAFIAYAGGNKKECLAILDALSCSYTEEKGVASCPVLEDAAFVKRLHSTWQKHQDIIREKAMVRHAAYELPWFMALLTRARKKGVLATSQFIWMRPLDRPLWYALNQCGGRAAWAEGFAPWAHYMAEEKAGTALREATLEQAVSSLRKSLDEQGWLEDTGQAAEAGSPSNPPSEKRVQPSPLEPLPDPDRVFAPPEEDPEYDVYDDPGVQNQQF
ncbi:MAG: hypothetical protein IJD16_07825 [Desulfovibrio sp.]|nr:hypothetical protein [Desulfovibrio sp.]